MSCTPTQANGPCNLLDVFPQELVDSVTGVTLGNLPGFGFTFEGQTTSARSVHMSIWSDDGRALLVDNLDGKAIEPD
ncbi:hypothetical protein IV203_017385 [Nitzschia inconspicua]|uniref:Uncharacterized protein n=1 Tax=Nitzschia inconspicua TaxID=303405 RepID=A0A9K3P7R3_9STRA|nr:hypothetical protein IV203_017572 [Nitzschia inconspicua]KAG7348680.1 hypothetical protein IV203_017385 [Nitzschia inconspicua]